ncbi:MAG: phosphoglucosamine mutase [Actinomycetota bacterium]|nr:phosphoglucosamine mutase [Actinomycetota bacterium]
MKRLFGTDGIRGVANRDVTPELALRLGEAACRELGSSQPKFVVARDTRLSGPMLESALTAGITAAGGEVLRCGVLPTPAVAFLARHLRADGGVVVSASHNPFEDNGIKFFGPKGAKLDDAAERRIEKAVERSSDRPEGAGVGRVVEVREAEELYVEHATAALEGRSLAGLKVVLDCAHGAAFRTTPEAFRRAGADVVPVSVEPDGTNINQACGSGHPEVVAEQVRSVGADLGLAHDGDADRVIAVDEAGGTVDGDAMIAILASELAEAGRLNGNLVVSTVMANLGFRRAIAREGLSLHETPVGDRYVAEAMAEKGAVIGGEQSGHIIMTDFSTTGDGLITGLRLSARVVSTGRKLSELASAVERYPQVLVNVRVPDPRAASSSAQVRALIEDAERAMRGSGRVLVRPSGTEPVVRVMVECLEPETANEVAEGIAEAIRKHEPPP